MNVKKWASGLLTLLVLFSFSLPLAEAKTEENNTAFIDVAVATQWAEPNILREIDVPSASNPVDMRKWTENLTYEDKLWLVGKLETQALYGSKVTILEEKGNWVKVAVQGQPTPRNPLGYPGWIPKKQIVKNKTFAKMQKKPFALITAPTAWLYEDKKRKKKFMEISFNTRLPVIKETKNALLVLTPSDGAKWLDQKAASIYKSEKDIPTPTGQDLYKTAKQFLGLPYLWAGMSGFGFDCSGFTHSIYKAHGITIPRDSSVQATHGLPVERENLSVGDLVFFAYNEGKGRVHHVGMYIGDGKMIHSPNSSTHVRIDDIETSGYGHEYAGARRYLD